MRHRFSCQVRTMFSDFGPLYGQWVIWAVLVMAPLWKGWQVLNPLNITVVSLYSCQWPYTYDSCDVGTVANQTVNGIPAAATVNGDKGDGGALSYLPGQRLSRCTCPGESHPGPKHSDGTFVGRSAPEIDIFEAQVRVSSLIRLQHGSRLLQIQRSPIIPEVSQSAQWAVCSIDIVHLCSINLCSTAFRCKICMVQYFG